MSRSTSLDPLLASTDIEYLRQQALQYRDKYEKMDNMFKLTMKECLTESKEKRDCGQMLDKLVTINADVNKELIHERDKNLISETFILNICNHMNKMCYSNTQSSSKSTKFTFKDVISIIQREYKLWQTKYWHVGK